MGVFSYSIIDVEAPKGDFITRSFGVEGCKTLMFILLMDKKTQDKNGDFVLNFGIGGVIYCQMKS